jgi:two-component system chemotaxis response regulator CheV
MKLEAESYLKSGSNELRVLEYRVGGRSFGINILKVCKIIKNLQCFISPPEAHPSVTGMFKDMDKVIPVIDLAHFLGLPSDKSQESKRKVLVTEFFSITNGFWVDRVDWIHHFHWEDVIDAQGVLKGFDQKYVIGIVKPTEDRMILMLDYETIILDLCPNLRSKDINRSALTSVKGSGKRILISEDSPSVRNMLETEFSELGFDVVSTSDGKEALDRIEADGNFDLVISDVEMPQMDGLALTCAIRNSDKFRELPVIVYSSIGDIGMKSRANFLKANAHITKLNVEELLKKVEELTN